MARAARLSPAHFSREFHRTFGESPHRYLLTRRLERAAELLRTTDRTVAEICFMLGLRRPSGRPRPPRRREERLRGFPRPERRSPTTSSLPAP